MKYKYTIETGRTAIRTNPKKYILGSVLSVALVAGLAVPALAAKPAHPGCFGADRAAALHQMQDDTFAYLPQGEPGASEWGIEAGKRAGTNGQVNRDYMASCEAL